MINTRIGRFLLRVLLPISIVCTLLLVAYQSGSWDAASQHRVRYHPKPRLNGTRENAAFVVLVRNEDLDSMRNTMQQLESRFNRKYGYPWIFLNDQPFDDRFVDFTSGLASGETFYGTLNSTMWGYPDWIDQEKARARREAMEQDGVIYGGSESYRHMCR